MNNNLITQLQEKDLFSGPSKSDEQGREKDLKSKPELLASIAADELEIIKFIHEDTLAPNHRINFTPELWIKILTNVEKDSPGTIEILKELEQNCVGALRVLDEATTQDILKEGGYK